MPKIILDLCGGSGSWSYPYWLAGYHVVNVSLPYLDVRTYQPPQAVYGILAAPPCTIFSTAGAWVKRAPTEWHEAIEIVSACLSLVTQCKPAFWCLENPGYGRLSRLMGKPALIFQPYDYGDSWTKKTALWGHFRPPFKYTLKEPIGSWTEIHHSAKIRSLTPPGFARAFFEANR
jgi:hypothetical protein